MGLTAMLDKAAAWWFDTPTPRRSAFPASLSFNDYLTFLTSGTSRFPLTTYSRMDMAVPQDFAGYVSGAYAANGIVFAAAIARAAIFSEARFKYRAFENGQPGRIYGDGSLAPLERFPGGQTSVDFLARLIGHADFAGNAFVVRGDGGLITLRPDWVVPVIGSRYDPVDSEAAIPDAEMIGLVYYPGGKQVAKVGRVYLPGEFRHWAPIKDPLSSWSGMSWLTPILREVMADNATTLHKLRFFENGATPNAVVTFGPDVDPDAYDAWVDAFEKKNKGAANAYKTVYLGGGTTLTPVGKDFQQIDLKAVQGAGETRIAVASGVPAVVLGISEGLAGSSLNAGNYTAARRRFADMTMRPLWRSVCGVLAPFVQVPTGSELWYDDSDIPFLQEDMKDAADIAQTQAIAVRNLVDAGYQPDAAVLAVSTGNLRTLTGKHSGLYSVQLQPAGSTPAPARMLEALALSRSTRPEDDEVRATTINVYQPDVAEALGEMRQAAEDARRMAALMEERAERAEARIADLVEREQPAPIVNVAVEASAPVVIPAPIVENRVDVATPVVQNTVVMPDVVSMRITEMPPAEATVVNDPKTGKAKTIKVK